ncbi:MAG: hypothetical protein ACTSRS_17285 [Candidatus Helarchaeota archaeon]
MQTQEGESKALKQQAKGIELKMGASSKRLLEVVFIAILTSLGISLGYLLAPFPNIEFLSFIIFIAGFLYGKLVGLGVGVLVPMIYYGWNPYGPSNPPIFITCVICMSLIGVIGGFLKPKISGKLLYSAWNVYKFAMVGFLLTLIFDLATNIVTGLIFYEGNIGLALFLGLPFLLLHTISNTVIFATCLIPTNNAIIDLIELR